LRAETGDNANNMCRSIKPLYNFDPPVSEDDVRAASLQYVRKISGYVKPSKANEVAFMEAVEAITAISNKLLNSLETSAQPRNRAEMVKRSRSRYT
jgi:hypothetical protein